MGKILARYVYETPIQVGRLVTHVSVGNYILTHQSHRTAFICDQSEVLFSTNEKSTELRKKITTAYLYHLGYSALLTGNYKPGLKVAVVGLGVLGISTANLIDVFGK